MYRLLIVDDEPQIIEGMKRIIDWEEYQVLKIETATTFEEAIDKAVDLRPHIALIDVCINERKGYDLISYLNKFTMNTNYIMISGYDEFQYAKKALMVGAKDYLLKPIDKNELKNVVEKIILEELHGIINIEKRNKDQYDDILNKEYESLSKLTQKVIVMIHSEYSKNINLKCLADRFGMNSNYLGQLFLKDTEMKFSEYLMKFRMKIAKELIEVSTDKIVNIAQNVGYTNMNYFYTQFQACYQVSPSEFRKQ